MFARNVICTQIYKYSISLRNTTFTSSLTEHYFVSYVQVIVQRTLASKSLYNAKAGCVMAAFLKLLPFWVLVFPGMAARVLFPDQIACVDPEECMKACGSKTGCSNTAYITLVVELLPIGGFVKLDSLSVVLRL